MHISSSSRTAFVSLLGLLLLAATAEAQRPGQGRPASGGGGGGGRPSAPSRPSAPAVSRPSAPSVSRPAPVASRPSPAPQRGSASPAPQPRPQPAPTPRYEAPPRPHYEPPATPRYEAPPARPATPRYEAPSTPRYDAPNTPRYDAPSGRSTDGGSPYAPAPGSARDGGRVYDGGARGGASGVPPTIGGSGRIEPARIDRSVPTPFEPRVWQPDGGVDLSGAVRTPRAGVPVLSGSRSGPAGGLASGRLERAGLDGTRPNSAAPQPVVDGDSLRARYGGGAGRSSAVESGRGNGTRSDDATARARGPGLSAGRTGGDRVAPVGGSRAVEPRAGEARTRTDAERGRARGEASKGGDVDDRVASVRRRAAAAERADPVTGHRLRAASKAALIGGAVGGGVVVGTGAGYYGGCWRDDVWDDCGWYWNSCWYGGWWWSWSFGWPYGSCWWGWPGSSWRWGYGSSYWGWCYSPWLYTTVVYETYDPTVIVVQQPAPEPLPVGGPVAAPAGAPAKAPPEVRADLEAAAHESLLAGDAAFREGRYSDAVRHYARAVECTPDRGSLWLILSDALFATGDYHYAAYALRRALELDPTLLETLVDKHGWYSDPTEFDRHIAWAEAYLRDHVLDEDARLILAANYLFAKRFASASDALESAFAAGLVETQAGKLVLERSRRALGVAAPR